ncbi:caspase family protein [Sulfitobacter pseudonitzschiae]|uniref:caspase family protein n=2 Tax=Pseudosulfitobacter pseudonitzschiae TaxID=1402135 RepID=UPI001AFCB16A|nr:caspase family protein [Pseudosulfitobacter pseudonitzschiae]MBM1817758.1 caspase family protein [Pseudosulfitobacter pseudonitzschiae]MBM1834753.1 caspase family protein [Pseudosulfitobacter pseudonitzschiae]MBM1844468.1 caspase family protein [Pseudosulfitobacter pseudonitzschiae]MBM1859017.1 caspase family protein [Pseudosulfitobacter pseudonitzschiae]MBM1863874.1 caspase family protein [Pseudosulfitobacter pseudonitzschiae]
MGRAMLRPALTALSLLAPLPALAENFALLIGASTYDNLEERYWLQGPANDVALVRTYLTDSAPVPFSADHVTVLADGVEGAGRPTLQGIRDGFAAMAARVGPGDFVYLHFSGHGTQAPALHPETEEDGLDEMFLPVDIGAWDDTVGTVENALVDDEIGVLIGSLRAKGATVWAVFDACHSGTVTRAAPADGEEVRMRKLDPAALGVPDSAMADAEATSRALPDPRARPASPVEGAEGDGAFIAFFAAQTTETTPEKRLPRGAPGRVSQGVFTYTIFETLAENPGVTYRQLGQEVLRKYAVQNLALSTPMFEGDLDGYVFSGEAGEQIHQWPVREGAFGLTLRAGQLQHMSEGEIVALLPTAASAVSDAVGYAKVTYTDTFTSELEPVAHEGLPALDVAEVPKGSYARKLADVVDFTLRVARPDGDVPAVVTATLDLLEQDAGGRLVLVPAGADADVRLAVMPDSTRPDAIWLLPGTGYFEPSKAAQTPSVGTTDRQPAEVAALMQDSLTQMGRAINLLRMGGQYRDTDLNVDLRLQTKTRQQRDLRDLDTVAVPVLVPDDQVHVLAQNNEAFPVDANVLHIGSDYAITHFYSGRLHPGDTLKKGLFRITDEAFGRDRVVVILTPAEPQSAVEDLRFLGQSAVEVMRGNDQSSSFAASLRNAGFGQVTRGAVALEDDSGPAPAILQFDIDTVAGN